VVTAVGDSVRVEHDDAHHRFVGIVADEELAVLSYRRHDGALDLLHTEVDPRARGRGIGEAFVRQVLDEARQRGDRIIATCPFVTAFIRDHPEYRDLLATR
jgi:uncharacterized protein